MNLKEHYFIKKDNETVVNMTPGQIEQMYDSLIRTQKELSLTAITITNQEQELNLLKQYHKEEIDILETVILEKEYENDMLNKNISKIEKEITELKSQNIKPKEIIKEIIKSDTDIINTLKKEIDKLSLELKDEKSNNVKIFLSVKGFVDVYHKQISVINEFCDYISTTTRYTQRIADANNEILTMMFHSNMKTDAEKFISEMDDDMIFGLDKKFKFKSIILPLNTTQEDSIKLQKQFISVQEIADYFNNHKDMTMLKMKKKYNK